MKFKSFLAAVLLAGLLATTLRAQSPEFSRPALCQNQNAPSFLTLSHYPALHFVDSLNAATTKPERSVGKALLFSAVVPGAGQFYNKSFWKGLAFVGVEIGAWAMNAIYTQRGNEKEDQFERYADAHWSEDEYRRWLDQQGGCNGSIDCQKRYESDHFSHFLPEEKNQTYYENIGKYDQFNVGWDDTDTELGRDSANRELYTRMRKSANDQFKIATYGASAVLVNHVLSMLDAAYSTHQYNRNQVKASMGMEMQRYDRELVPALSVRMSW